MYVEKIFQHHEHSIPYLIDYPDGYSPEKQYPVIVYLHGYGFVLSDIDRLKKDCPLQRGKLPSDMPCILIAPKCSEHNWLFHFESLSAFFEDIVRQPFCDSSRIYLCGTSMGSYASWIVLMEKRKFFAAAVICCGGGPYWGAEFYTETPIRLVHGEKDTVVLYRESEIMASRINEKGGNVELIGYKDLDHNIWSVTFDNPETYQWMFSHKRT